MHVIHRGGKQLAVRDARVPEIPHVKHVIDAPAIRIDKMLPETTWRSVIRIIVALEASGIIFVYTRPPRFTR